MVIDKEFLKTHNVKIRFSNEHFRNNYPQYSPIYVNKRWSLNYKSKGCCNVIWIKENYQKCPEFKHHYCTK